MRRGIPARSEGLGPPSPAPCHGRPTRRGRGRLAVATTAFVALAIASADPASADLASEFICHIATDDARPGRSHSSPLFDEELIELQTFGRPGKIRGHGVTGYVAFTFDDGPKAETTPAVVAALLRYDVPAMFFAVGWRLDQTKSGAQTRRQILAEVHANGFDIGNHTYKHVNLRGLEPSAVAEQIERTAADLQSIIGYRPHAFRPPYGAGSATVVAELARRNMSQIMWTIDTKDFYQQSAAQLRRRITAQILSKGGGIVLMHDTKGHSAEAIPGILDDLETENCRRLERDEAPIIPVSLHYFMRTEDGQPAVVPALVRARTARYLKALPERCAAPKLAY